MGELNINNSVEGTVDSYNTAFSVDATSTDGAYDQKETKWINDEWGTQLAYYQEIPELQAVVDAIATWVVGKGYSAEPQTQFILDFVKGFGKDDFDTIIENMIRTMIISGDSYAEIIRDDKKNLINIKPLDPSTIEIVVDSKGIITKYNQIAKTGNKGPVPIKKENMLHFCRNRIADQIHGTSLIPALKNIIDTVNEMRADQRKIFHNFANPRFVFHMDTDDPVKIAAFKAKMDQTQADGENIYVPKDAIVPEQLSVAPNSTLNHQPVIDANLNKFYQAAKVPQVIVGGGQGFTDGATKVEYLAFQTNIEEHQLYVMTQIGQQLGMEIKLEFNSSLLNDLISNVNKDEKDTSQPNDLTVGSGQ